MTIRHSWHGTGKGLPANGEDCIDGMRILQNAVACQSSTPFWILPCCCEERRLPEDKNDFNPPSMPPEAVYGRGN